MRHAVALLTCGALLAALAPAATGFIAPAPRAADVRPPTNAFNRTVHVPAFDTAPQAPFDDTPITPRESVAAFDRG